MTDDSVFREVEEELRQDEYKRLWDRYGKLIIAAVTAVILAVGGWQTWSYFDRQAAEQAATLYLDAVKKAEDGNLDDASAALQAINHKSLSQLKVLKEAELLAQKGEIDKAVAAFDAAASNASGEKVFADIARIKSGYLLVDSQTPDQLLVRLGQYDKDGEPWRHHAREIFGLSAWRIKDYAMADRYFKALFDDPETPANMRQRAQRMVQLIAPNVGKK
jgi:hypothetical protein